MALKKIPLTQEYIKSILNYNPKTGCFKWKWRKDIPNNINKMHLDKIAGRHSQTGYIEIGINSKLYGAHRLAWLWMTGEWPLETIDHRNLIGTDNRWDNLRQATTAENSYNTCPRGDLGIKGVTLHPNGKYRVRIKIKNKQFHLGYYFTIDEAEVIAQTAYNKLHGEFCRIK